MSLRLPQSGQHGTNGRLQPPLRYWLALCGTLSAAAAHADVCSSALDEVEADWRLGRLTQVVAGLRPHEASCVSNPRFDRVLGESLLASGQSAAALAPLERATTLDPDDQAAWRALSQAWRELGDPDAARMARQAMTAKRYAPLPVAEAGFHWQTTLESGVGHDSNATLAPYDSTISVPSLGNTLFTLSPASRQRSASYRSGLLHAEGRWDTSTRSALSLSATKNERRYDGLPIATTDEYTVTARYDRDEGALGIWSLGALSDRLMQGKDMTRTATGGSLEWRPAPISPWQPVVAWNVTRYNTLRTKADDDNFSEQLLTLAATVPLGRTTFGASLLGGHDQTGPHHSDGNRDVVSLRLSANGKVFGKAEWYAWVERMNSRYAKPDPTFQRTRQDTLDTAGTGISVGLRYGFSLRTQLTLSKQHSTIPLYAYHRADCNLVLSYELGK
ncbi:tetratricopeptide repeat protein [Paludibacterium yongneupense]|uniref:tetratricopeptide repeat protein n=1 Tax=Paludibacterium yongneupense TaxID=400061 RepID=UPI00048C4F2B|nr:tetratricopeptide repeat protein [Paludibacterium yongneupense]